MSAANPEAKKSRGTKAGMARGYKRHRDVFESYAASTEPGLYA